MRPSVKPKDPRFSSGPTKKHPGWSLHSISTHSIGRSHRSAHGLGRIRHMVALTREILQIPHDYHVALISGSCTGAMEAAMWSLLGPLPVDVVTYEFFGNLWVHDIIRELKLPDTHVLDAGPGSLPDLSSLHFNHDLVFVWNGSSTGVIVPNGDWISPHRNGLVLCDATSAVFAVDIPWNKLDAVAFSWQKALGGEGGHGILVLSPKAVERLNTHIPKWPIPRLFRLAQEGKFSSQVFEGMTLNTPSLLCIEDCIDSLLWCASIGGLPALISRSKSNLKVIEDWVSETPWIDFLAHDPQTRSPTSICLYFPEAPNDWELPKAIASLLEEEGVAHDILGHTLSDPTLRIWGGPLVETSNIEALLPWITWAYKKVK